MLYLSMKTEKFAILYIVFDVIHRKSSLNFSIPKKI